MWSYSSSLVCAHYRQGYTASRWEMTHKDAPKLVQHPVRRRIEALQMLLRPASHIRESLLGSTAFTQFCSICQAITLGNEAAMVGEGCRGNIVLQKTLHGKDILASKSGA